MPDDEKTLTQTADDVNQIADGGSSTSDRPLTSADSENTFGTVEDEVPGPSPSQDDKTGTDAEVEEAAKAAKEKEAEDSAKAKGDAARYDKDPAWQRIIQDRNELRERLARAEGRLEVLDKTLPGKEPKEAPYTDITTKSDEELREWQERDPKGYAANLYQQIRIELGKEHDEVEQSRTANTSIKKTFDDYASKNPDFMPMWESGELQKFMKSNPGHNAISAHILLTEEKRKGETEKQFNDRLGKAVKEAEEKVTKNFKAKKTASKVLSAGTALPIDTEETELKDTKSRGGLTAVLTERLKRMRGGATA